MKARPLGWEFQNSYRSQALALTPAVMYPLVARVSGVGGPVSFSLYERVFGRRVWK